MSSLPSREETLGFLRWQLEVCEKAQIVIDDPDGWLQRVRPKLRSDFIVHARTNYPASLRAEIAVLDLHGPLLSAFPHAARPPEASCGPCRTRSTCTTILPIIEAHAEQTRAWLTREAKDAAAMELARRLNPCEGPGRDIHDCLVCTGCMRREVVANLLTAFAAEAIEECKPFLDELEEIGRLMEARHCDPCATEGPHWIYPAVVDELAALSEPKEGE